MKAIMNTKNSANRLKSSIGKIKDFSNSLNFNKFNSFSNTKTNLNFSFLNEKIYNLSFSQNLLNYLFLKNPKSFNFEYALRENPGLNFQNEETNKFFISKFSDPKNNMSDNKQNFENIDLNSEHKNNNQNNNNEGKKNEKKTKKNEKIYNKTKKYKLKTLYYFPGGDENNQNNDEDKNNSLKNLILIGLGAYLFYKYSEKGKELITFQEFMDKITNNSMKKIGLVFCDEYSNKVNIYGVDKNNSIYELNEEYDKENFLKQIENSKMIGKNNNDNGNNNILNNKNFDLEIVYENKHLNTKYFSIIPIGILSLILIRRSRNFYRNFVKGFKKGFSQKPSNSNSTKAANMKKENLDLDNSNNINKQKTEENKTNSNNDINAEKNSTKNDFNNTNNNNNKNSSNNKENPNPFENLKKKFNEIFSGSGTNTETKSEEKIKPAASNIKFKDVAGLHNTKQEVKEFVNFLTQGEKYENLGARIPRGALFTGPPGTGKTLLAKAIAGEADVNFYYSSGSEYQKKYVGQGAAEIRKLFDKARENAPAIIFIDEIDSIGKKRDSFMNNIRDDDGILNQLLVEMDGFGTDKNVIIFGATNRSEILDSALLRSGRFDRKIEFNNPNKDEREEILKIYLEKIKLDFKEKMDEYAKRLAKLTPNFSGADLANLVNEAAIISAREKKESVDSESFGKSFDRVYFGIEQKKPNNKKELNHISYYESAKVVCSWFLENVKPIIRVKFISFISF